jgi:pimeloyl-ACP methyl ester carboxylesterase
MVNAAIARSDRPREVLGDLYPFESHFHELEDGHRMHYIDEGAGNPVLLVHGNPTWSFYFRNVVQRLKGSHRCIAPDHIGCGWSDKPSDGDYPYSLSRRVDDLSRLVDALELEQTDLVVHDWGGMIGMAWAVRNPDRVRRLVVLNTAAFFLPGGKAFPFALSLARVPGLGSMLVRGMSAFSRGANRLCVTRRPMPGAVARGYLAPYRNWAERIAVHRFVVDIPLREEDPAFAVVDETSKRLETLSEHPMFVGWGMRDFVFDHHFLAEWEHRFPDAEVHRFEDAGHYVLEDAIEDLGPQIEAFLS